MVSNSSGLIARTKKSRVLGISEAALSCSTNFDPVYARRFQFEDAFIDNGVSIMRTAFVLSIVFFLLPPAVFADSNYEFRNASPSSIVVRMDTWREKHSIAPGGSAVFTKANLFDQPTFWVYIDGNKDGEPDKKTQEATKKVPLEWAVNARGVLEWDGKKIIVY